MTKAADLHPPTDQRVENLPLILRALSQAVREALMRHKQAANPVAVWRNGRVEWVKPENIPLERSPGEKAE